MGSVHLCIRKAAGFLLATLNQNRDISGGWRVETCDMYGTLASVKSL